MNIKEILKLEDFDEFMLAEYGKWKIGRVEAKNYIRSHDLELLKAVVEIIGEDLEKRMWVCSGEDVITDKEDDEHLTYYPCEKHKYSSGHDATFAINQERQRILGLIKKFLKYRGVV